MLGLNPEGLKFIVIGKFSIFFSRIILYENAICHVLSIQSFALQNFFIPRYSWNIGRFGIKHQSINQAGRSHYQLAAVLHVFPEPVK
jgi:hypothetical protein